MAFKSPREQGRRGGRRPKIPHDLDTCQQPVCVETRRIIRARGSRQRTPRVWEGRNSRKEKT